LTNDLIDHEQHREKHHPSPATTRTYAEGREFGNFRYRNAPLSLAKTHGDELAGLPVFETLAAIETTLEADRASVWLRALGNLRAAGVAAGVVLGVGAVTLAGVAPQKAQAAEKQNNSVARPAGIEPATPAFGGQYSIH
jgi:hypothetical protein